MRRVSHLALILAMVASPTAIAQIPKALAGPSPDTWSKEAEAAKAFQRLQVPGKHVNKAVEKVRRLKWHSSLTPASRQAKQEGKPILWIQALGTLKGYT